MRLGAALPASAFVSQAWAFASKDFWEAKPSTEWNADEVDRMLTKSPWAKEVSATPDRGRGGVGNGGGTGQPRGGGGGIGFPGGGGIGFPGGGGIGFPGGGQRGGGGGGQRYPDGGGTDGGNYPRAFNGTVRWESAQPVRDALRIGAPNEKPGDQPDSDFAKYYVIHLVGDLPEERGRRGDGSGAEDDDDDSARGGRSRDSGRPDSRSQNDRRMRAFERYTRLERKDGALKLEKVEEGSRVGSQGPGIYFYFSRAGEISMDDKAVTFSTKLDSAAGSMEIKARFTLREMRYQGKLAL